MGLLIASALFAVALVQALIIGRWRNAITVRPFPALEAGGALPSVTVIVPARNEEASIVQVLQDLHRQSYPKVQVQVIVVDDGSTDRTAIIAEEMRHAWPQLQVLRSKGSGKKAAITTGIDYAEHELIVLTDADARFGPKRISTIVRAMRNGDVDLLILPVWTDGEGWLGALQREEQTALLGVTLGDAIGESATLAYGANLAFKREVFRAVGGYHGDRFASGDDVFLLRRMRAQGKRVQALIHADALVNVDAEASWRGFLVQRLRWAGKMRGAASAFSLLGAIGLLWPWALVLFTARFSFIGAMGQHGFDQLILLLMAWVLWAAPVIGLVQDVKRAFGKPSGTAPALMALFAFSVYAPVIALLSLVVRPKWKGRRLVSP
jgi:cellulose synthase/poly-beta-1,6-N-acetylglucosamine synthase-like glycosyltransferase